VTSVNKFTVPPLRTLRIPERKTCLPIEKPGGCNLQTSEFVVYILPTKMWSDVQKSNI